MFKQDIHEDMVRTMMFKISTAWTTKSAKYEDIIKSCIFNLEYFTKLDTGWTDNLQNPDFHIQLT